MDNMSHRKGGIDESIVAVDIWVGAGSLRNLDRVWRYVSLGGDHVGLKIVPIPPGVAEVPEFVQLCPGRPIPHHTIDLTIRSTLFNEVWGQTYLKYHRQCTRHCQFSKTMAFHHPSTRGTASCKFWNRTAGPRR